MTTKKSPDPEELKELPLSGWQTVTLWAVRFGWSRKTFMGKLKQLGIEPHPIMDTVNAETLYAAMERTKNDDERQVASR